LGPALNTDPHQFADAIKAWSSEMNGSISMPIFMPFWVYSVRKAPRIVPADAEGRLGQIVGAEGEELGRLGDLGGAQGRARQFDHRADLIARASPLSAIDRFGHPLDAAFRYPALRRPTTSGIMISGVTASPVLAAARSTPRRSRGPASRRFPDR
jgi:hypothetical protein